MSDKTNKTDYDSDPVEYCSKCYSLKIKYIDAIDSDCCMECGCSDVATASSIYEWEKLYERRYGHKYTVKSNDPRKSLLFKMSIERLKTTLYRHSLCDSIIKEMYPKFPGGLSKADSVILFFDKVIKENRIDELRLTLIKNLKQR